MNSCPRDNTRLRPRELSDLTISFCGTCNGFALPLHDAEALIRRVRTAPNWPHSRLPAPSVSISKGPLECTCARTSTMQWLERGNVVIDFCRRCRHLWLDAGEARAIERFFIGPQALPLLAVSSTTPFAQRDSSSLSVGDAVEGTIEVADFLGNVIDAVSTIVDIIGALLECLGDL